MKKLLLLILITTPTIFYGMLDKKKYSYVVYNIEYISQKDAFMAVAQNRSENPSDSRTTTVMKKMGSMEILHKSTTSFTTNGRGIEFVTVDLDEQGVEAAVNRLIEHEKSLELKGAERKKKPRRI